MSAERPHTYARSPSFGEIARRAALCAGGALAVGALAGLVVVIAGLGSGVRAALALPLAGWPRSLTAAVDIAAHNTRIVLVVLLCAHVAPRVGRRIRRAIDVALALQLAYNGWLIGVALGAYGARLAAPLALHLPLEAGAISLAGGVYLSARRSPVRGSTIVAVGASCCALLLAAGLLETFTPLERPR